ncbi:MAG TPA: hypothetical protein VF265_09045 [Nevskiaceae bacterium]
MHVRVWWSGLAGALLAALAPVAVAAIPAPTLQPPDRADATQALSGWFRSGWWLGSDCMQVAPPLVIGHRPAAHYPWRPPRGDAAFSTDRANALVTAGLLTKQGATYYLTAAGRDDLARPDGLAFCTGYLQLGRVVSVSPVFHDTNVTQPLAKVTYTYAITGVPGWAHDPAVQLRFQSLAEELQGGWHKCTVQFIHGSAGWRVDTPVFAPCLPRNRG